MTSEHALTKPISSLAEELTASKLTETMAEIGAKAATAANDLKKATPDQKNMALRQAAGEIRKNSAYILKANVADLEFASNKQLRESLLDRLKLDTNRLENIAEGLETIAELPDPIGTVLNKWERPNGLIISRVRVPLGVIGIIYESRPNVTADAGGLCLKSGNSTILRGGSESINTSQALVECLQIGLAHSNLPRTAVQLIPTRNRDAVGHLLRMTDYVDIIVPRGGKSLVERVQKESRIPTIAHLEGICHVYLDDSADLLMACEISLNAKMRRPGVCGAMETLLVDKAAASRILPSVAEQLFAAGCTLKGDKDSRMLIPEMEPASEIDWTTEYLDTILAVKLVDGVQGAIDHINAYGSNHTDSIVTNDEAAAERFLGEVDSAIVLHNASTQYADGGEFGMGAEIGISTGRLHARGPVGADQLTCFKYVVRGNGQIRP